MKMLVVFVMFLQVSMSIKFFIYFLLFIIVQCIMSSLKSFVLYFLDYSFEIKYIMYGYCNNYNDIL